jgi:peptidyl-prolyl cis-trans isomerase SurA
MKNLLCVLAVFLAALSVPDGAAAERELIDRIVAVVEDEAIFESDVQMLITQMMFQQGRTSMTDAELAEVYNRILEEMINDKLVIAQASRLDVDIPFEVVEERVNKAIEDNKRALGGEVVFESQLEREGFTMESLKALYRQQIRNRMLVEEVLRMEVDRGALEIGEQELRDFYEEKKDEFPLRPAVVNLKTIFVGFESSEQVQVDARAKIADIREQAMSGESFSDLAKRYSEDPSGPLGGDLGFVKPEDLADENFANAAATLGIGEISEPIQTAYGYHILQVTERNPDTGEARLRHILIRMTANEEDIQSLYANATDIRRRIDEGESFEELADQYSTDPNAGEGGDLGWLRVEDLPEFFQDVLSGMKPGDVSQVLRESAGFRIVKMVDRQPPRPYEFEEIRGELQRLYEADKMEDLYKTYVKDLRDRFHVKVYQH